jgi:signal transduction histidine kinase
MSRRSSDLPGQVSEPGQGRPGAVAGRAGHSAECALLEAVACATTGAGGLEASFTDLARCLCDRLGVDSVILTQWRKATEAVTISAATPPAAGLVGKAVARAATVAELAEGQVSAAACADTRAAFDSFYHLLATVGLRAAAGVRVWSHGWGAWLLWIASRADVTSAQVEALGMVGEALAEAFEAPKAFTDDLLMEPGGLTADQEQILALGNLARSAGHEINNALAAILGQCQLLLEELGEDRRTDRVRVIMNRSAVLMNMARALEEYGSVKVVEPVETVDLGVLALEAIATTRAVWGEEAVARGMRIDVEIQADEPIMIKAAPAALKRALVHVIFNAIQALDETGGTVRVQVTGRDDEAVCEIIDSGCGMAPEVLRMARQPFFTTRPRTGKGLGLSLAEAIVRQHGGDLEIRSEPACGTAVVMYVPLARR